MEFITTTISSFVYSPEFWAYHGFVLSGLWVILSAFAIAIKSKNTLLHVLSFAIIDFTTLFFAGAALFRVFPKFVNFLQWGPLKQGHVAGGTIFMIVIIMQHLGGVFAFLSGKPNPQHRQFGRAIATVGRAIAGFGWALAGNINNAMIVGFITALLLVLGMIWKDKQVKQDLKVERNRPKSPKGKRQ